MGYPEKDIQERLFYIRDICVFVDKALCRITKEDADDYIRFNNLYGDRLLKVKSIFKMFANNTAKDKHKIIIINKNNEFIAESEVVEKLNDSAINVKKMMLDADKKNKSYCFKTNSIVTYCKMEKCQFYGLKCTSHPPPVSIALDMEIMSTTEQALY